ncbi:MAG: cyclic lactone autoinducer peptide [Lachnospiraceae bacterium]|nr:cyclic lactone autoinducer peptide [Lachnospiraceae bacterium]
MKKLVAKLRTMNMANCLAALAMIFTVVGGNSVCTCIFHDVEKPDLTQFRKF